jgi:hypothetical protein
VVSPFDRAAGVVFVTATAAAGVVAAYAAVAMPGLIAGGSACGGGGGAQRCTAIARELSLVDVSWRAWWYVVGGALCVAVAAIALVVRRQRSARLGLALAMMALAFAGLVQIARVDAKLGPSDGTYGRTTEEWGGFLAPALLDLRRDALQRYAGRLTEPGGPRYDREQILDSFFVRARDGWRALYGAVVVLFFTAVLEAVRRIVARPSVAVVAAATGGFVVWAAVVDRAGTCSPDASECYRGLLTALAVAAAVLAWAAYGLGVVTGRAVRRANRE